MPSYHPETDFRARTEHKHLKHPRKLETPKVRGVGSMSGHRATHCGYCCPPPPLSERQIEHISQILSTARTDKKDLDDWDLTLTCDHVVRRTQHREP
jgi:hypothetical protein